MMDSFSRARKEELKEMKDEIDMEIEEVEAKAEGQITKLDEKMNILELIEEK